MPETQQVSQFVDTLEPFYKAAYKNKEKAPPIFNILFTKHGEKQDHMVNGHASTNGTRESKVTVPPGENVMQNGVGEHKLNTSKASLLHNINTISDPDKELNGDIPAINLLNSKEIRELKECVPDIKKG